MCFLVIFGCWIVIYDSIIIIKCSVVLVIFISIRWCLIALILYTVIFLIVIIINAGIRIGLLVIGISWIVSGSGGLCWSFIGLAVCFIDLMIGTVLIFTIFGYS